MAPSAAMAAAEPVRCPWCGDDPLYVAYHDDEWGVPVRDDRRLFEKICLEGFQSGLSWITILRKRPAFRAAFADFDVDAVARFGDADVRRLLADAGIVRHRGKIESAIHNARRFRALVDEEGSFAGFLARYAPDDSGVPGLSWAELRQRTTSKEAVALAKELKRRGFTFVGPTTVYAFMQAMGLVNDHVAGCFVRPRVEAARVAARAAAAG